MPQDISDPNTLLINNFNKDLTNNIHYRKDENISDFFEDSTIFITGGTGFLGKILIEKLLRSCIGIKSIYMLMRSKRGENSTTRYKEYLKNQVFERVRIECPDALKKLKFISGDMSLPYLGLNDIDRQFLIDSVDITFHCAATVKFNEPLSVAANLNTLGTERIMELCGKMLKLKSFVHVSTAFCNPNVEICGEQIYTKSKLTKDEFLNCLKNLPNSFIDEISSEIMGKTPNTYIYTKAMAEQIVCEYNNKFPISIVRPSIVTAAAEEPMPGFVDNVQGMNGLVLAMVKGSLKVALGDVHYALDMIPVDIVGKTIISAAWLGSMQLNNSHIKVYNCVSGASNPFHMGKLQFACEKWARTHPPERVLMYPSLTFIANLYIFKLAEFIFHFLPAYLIDFIRKLQGSKPIMVKYLLQIQAFSLHAKFVTLRNWSFIDANMKNLVKQTNLMSDGENFSCDISGLNWIDYMENFVLGIRKFLLKEDDETLKKSRKRLSILYYVQNILLGLIFAFIGFLILKFII